jgi:hypothetical protein
LKIPAPFYAFNFLAAQCASILAHQAFVHAAFVNVNPLPYRDFL